LKKYISVIIAIVLSLSLFVGCGGDSGSNGDSNGGTADTIKIGVNYELSGEVASYGQSSVDGIEMAIAEINAAGGLDGKEIQLIKYDNKSEPAEATTLATKLMTQDNVLAVLGPATSGAFKSTIPIAEKNKIAVASGSATADDVTVDANGVKEYAFRICFSDSYQGTAMAAYATEKLDAKKAVIIKDNSSDYGKGLAENFTQKFTELGGEIVAEEAYVQKETDFNAIITKIKGLDYDVIYLPGYYNEAGLIIKQARAQGINVPILGADGFAAPELVELAGTSALTDVYFTNHYSSLDESAKVQDFIASFKERYNKEPDGFHALGYDLAKFVVDAIGRAEALNGEAVKSALESTENFEGVTGTISIDENHNAVKDILVIKYVDGVQSSVERIGE
jgi:branched-chain amino acid transport system substrate-binding protein